jgi:hypothetical protein
LRSDVESEPRVYALLIQDNDIVDYRLALMIDGCANERFEPLPGPKPIMSELDQARSRSSKKPIK